MKAYKFKGKSTRYFSNGAIYPVKETCTSGLVFVDNQGNDHRVGAATLKQSFTRVDTRELVRPTMLKGNWDLLKETARDIEPTAIIEEEHNHFDRKIATVIARAKMYDTAETMLNYERDVHKHTKNLLESNVDQNQLLHKELLRLGAENDIHQQTSNEMASKCKIMNAKVKKLERELKIEKIFSWIVIGGVAAYTIYHAIAYHITF